MKFKRVALFTSSLSNMLFGVSQQIEEILTSKGCKIFYDRSFHKLIKDHNFKTFSESHISRNADLVIAIGGDGSMLSCSRIYGTKNIPIMGINLGKLGFLTDIAPNELTTKLLEVIDGSYEEDKRFFLESNVLNQEANFRALNEIVLHSGAIAQMIDFELFIDDVFVYRQKADGLIISSPTGSTAYSLSGGGPILHPNLDAISIVPMFPHSLSSSPLVVQGNSRLKLRLMNPKNKAQISFDSHESINLRGEHEIDICKSLSMLKLVHPVGHDFYSGCRNKLGWSTGIVN